MNNKTKKLARAGIIAALYVTLTLLFAFSSISTAVFQVRVSEALTILPLLFPESVISLYVGCLIANIISGNILDVLIGSLATLVAAILTYFCRFIPNRYLKVIVGVIPPIVVNAFVVPITYTILAGAPELYWAEVAVVGVGQLISAGVLGILLYLVLVKGLKIHDGVEEFRRTD